MKTSLLQAACPTLDALFNPGLEFFKVGYSWVDPKAGELSCSTVVADVNAAAAVLRLKRENPHLTKVWLWKQ